MSRIYDINVVKKKKRKKRRSIRDSRRSLFGGEKKRGKNNSGKKKSTKPYLLTLQFTYFLLCTMAVPVGYKHIYIFIRSFVALLGMNRSLLYEV